MTRLGRGAAVSAVLAACLVGLLYAGIWGFEIRSHRPWRDVSRGAGAASSTVSAVRFYPLAATAMLGGLRGFAADLLWLKMDVYWHHGQWHRVLPMYHLIVTLQPRFAMAWSLGAWHMAYNISDRAGKNPDYSASKREDERRRWIDEGVRFLREGLQYNEDKPDLYFDLGWTYFDKVKDYPAAIGYLQKALCKGESQLTMRVLAHAYNKAGRPADALRIWEQIDAQGGSAAKKNILELRKKMGE